MKFQLHHHIVYSWCIPSLRILVLVFEKYCYGMDFVVQVKMELEEPKVEVKPEPVSPIKQEPQPMEESDDDVPLVRYKTYNSL